MEKLKRGMEMRLDKMMEIDTAKALYKLSAYLTTTATRIPPPAEVISRLILIFSKLYTSAFQNQLLCISKIIIFESAKFKSDSKKRRDSRGRPSSLILLLASPS